MISIQCMNGLMYHQLLHRHCAHHAMVQRKIENKVLVNYYMGFQSMCYKL